MPRCPHEDMRRVQEQSRAMMGAGTVRGESFGGACMCCLVTSSLVTGGRASLDVDSRQMQLSAWRVKCAAIVVLIYTRTSCGTGRVQPHQNRIVYGYQVQEELDES